LTAIGDGFDIRSLAVTYSDGMRLSRHSHAWGQLAFSLSGAMRVVTDETAWLTPPTRALWLPPGVAHAIVMQGSVAMRTLYVAPTRAAPLPTSVTVFEAAPLLRELILHILGIGMLNPQIAAHDRLAGLLIDLLDAAPRQDLALPLPRDPRAAALAQLLLAAPDAKTDLPALAGAAGASLRTLQRLFPRQTGLTLEAWRRKARLTQAAVQLAQGASVTRTAFDCGYDSQSAFIGAFKQQFGTTPGRYRNGAPD
jgi:AraC-like DNA-binding protein